MSRLSAAQKLGRKCALCIEPAACHVADFALCARHRALLDAIALKAGVRVTSSSEAARPRRKPPARSKQCACGEMFAPTCNAQRKCPECKRGPSRVPLSAERKARISQGLRRAWEKRRESAA